MASTLDFTEYILGQINMDGNISYKKMFGEYGFYCDGKFFGCVSDNQFFIKITDAGKGLLHQCEIAPPYDGAKPYFLISELENKDFLAVLIRKTCDELPMPKPKKKKLVDK